VVVASSEKGIPMLDPVGTVGLSCVVLWGDDVPEGAASFKKWIGEAPSDFVPVQRGRGDLAAVCYTSGTTGHPKGAMQSHRAVISAAGGTVVMGARGPDDRVINALPLAHVYGSCVFDAAMMAGSPLIMVPRFDAAEVMAAIAEHRDADGRSSHGVLLLARPSELRRR
jgi:long-chain acyl-CoA synthetase